MPFVVTLRITTRSFCDNVEKVCTSMFTPVRFPVMPAVNVCASYWHSSPRIPWAFQVPVND